tara:strand:- start:26 stop:220 length:195 start_codon:yes stop_codon:yes gene_type:complete
MNTIKFTNYNAHGVPQNIILKKSTSDSEIVEVLDKVRYTRYYDKHDKKYNSFKKFFKINNENYI